MPGTQACLYRTRMRGVISVLVVALTLAAALAAAAQTPRKIIIDTDPGTDDSMAILLALNSPELEVQALTIVPGNVELAQGLENALKLVSLARRCDVPVAAGAERPLAQALETAKYVHGQKGLADVELPAPTCQADARFGPDLIIELVHRHPGEITLMPVGPLTNIALAVLQDPSIVPLVKEVVLMGGSALWGGNMTAAAEFNVYNDPEAAQIVFHAGWPVTMIGLDVTMKTLFTRDHLAQLRRTRGPLNDFAAAVTRYLIERMEQYGLPGAPIHDALAVGAAIDRSLITTECWPVNVETRGEHTRGMTVADRRPLGTNEPCAQVAVGVDHERFNQLFLSRLRGK